MPCCIDCFEQSLEEENGCVLTIRSAYKMIDHLLQLNNILQRVLGVFNDKKLGALGGGEEEEVEAPLRRDRTWITINCHDIIAIDCNCTDGSMANRNNITRRQQGGPADYASSALLLMLPFCWSPLITDDQTRSEQRSHMTSVSGHYYYYQHRRRWFLWLAGRVRVLF